MIEIVEISDIDRKRVLAALRCYRANIEHLVRRMQELDNDPDYTGGSHANLIAYNQTELRDLDQLMQSIKEKPIITR